MGRLDGRTYAILVTKGFEEVELLRPKEAIEREGGRAVIVSPIEGRVRAWNHADWGREIDVDVPLAQADPDDFDGLMLPGGVLNPDLLRQDRVAVRFVRRFFADDKPIAAICHAPWMLIEAGVVQGRELTSYPSLRKDLTNAGARWVDRATVLDGRLLTSRRPGDLDAFCAEMVELFAQGAPVAPS